LWSAKLRNIMLFLKIISNHLINLQIGKIRVKKSGYYRIIAFIVFRSIIKIKLFQFEVVNSFLDSTIFSNISVVIDLGLSKG
jgi:hypothetical protein